MIGSQIFVCVCVCARYVQDEAVAFARLLQPKRALCVGMNHEFEHALHCAQLAKLASPAVEEGSASAAAGAEACAALDIGLAYDGQSVPLLSL